MFPGAVAYLLAINLAAYAAFARDKRCAQRRLRRIPERTLLGLAALGGSSGAIAAQQLLRHKTRKQPFGAQLWLIVAAQACALAAVVALYARR